ncbi:hypothetical protein ACOME3_005197 [Neoechinorhynchus agilis]
MDPFRRIVALNYSKNVIQVGKRQLEHSHEKISKVRAIVRFLIANLYHGSNTCSTGKEYPVLQLMKARTFYVFRQFDSFSKNYDFDKAYQCLEDFVIDDVSAEFSRLFKDKLYYERNSPETLEFECFLQALIYHILLRAAPFIPHVAEELYEELCFMIGATNESIFKQIRTAVPADWENGASSVMYDRLKFIRKEMSSLETGFVGVCLPKYPDCDMDKMAEMSKEVLNCAWVQFNDDYRLEFKEVIQKAKCLRCRSYYVSEDNHYENLCSRCRSQFDKK